MRPEENWNQMGRYWVLSAMSPHNLSWAKTCNNYLGIESAQSAEKIADHPPIFRFWGEAYLIGIYMYIVTIINIMISFSYKRISNLLSSAQIKHSSLAGALYLQT